MGFSMGVIAGVMYAKRLGSVPHIRLKKYYEKCRTSYPNKQSICFYTFRLGHLVLAALLLYLQYFIYTVIRSHNESVLITYENHIGYQKNFSRKAYN
jgi:hypothetical protein